MIGIIVMIQTMMTKNRPEDFFNDPLGDGNPELDRLSKEILRKKKQARRIHTLLNDILTINILVSL